MHTHPLRYTLVMIMLFLCVWGTAGCGSVTPFPTSTPTLTPTRTPRPTPTHTPTPVPTSTPILAPIPTSLMQDPSALPFTEECRRVVDGLYAVKQDLGLPENLMSENPVRQETDFDPNQYFKILTHLGMKPGFQLDFLYFSDDLGGKPLVYARPTGSTQYGSYTEFLQSFDEEMSGERSYGSLGHMYDYLGKVQIDGSPESYFEFVTLAFLGDQFYLRWHGAYNDLKIFCDPGDMRHVNEEMKDFDLELPEYIQNGIGQIDFTPKVLVEDETVTVRIVAFTKWGGFFENIYVMERDNPVNLLNVQTNPLIEYDCGINF